MMETFVALGLWLTFVWFYDPDGFRPSIKTVQIDVSTAARKST